MAVPTVNLVIEQGADFARTYSLKKADNTPLDLTFYTFEAHMIKSRSSIHRGMQGNMISMGTTFGNNPAQGQLTVSFASTMTSVGILTAGRYDYDIVIKNTNNNKKTKVIQGQALVNGTAI